MGVRFLHDGEQGVLYCSTTDWAFGPVIADNAALGKDPEERATAFLKWLVLDPRQMTEAVLSLKWSEWLAQEADYFARERKDELEKDEELLGPEEATELAALRTQFAS